MRRALQENGGPMVWSRAAWGAGTTMGDAVAFLAGWMSFLFSAVDAALYPSMFVSAERYIGFTLSHVLVRSCLCLNRRMNVHTRLP
jgi:hypothetical protein